MWLLAKSDPHPLLIFEQNVLRKIYGPKLEELPDLARWNEWNEKAVDKAKFQVGV